MKATSIRLGVDIGGTFTDVVLDMPDHRSRIGVTMQRSGKRSGDGSGRAPKRFSTKVLTTHTVPEDGIINGMLAVCQLAEISPSDIDQIIHGTTLATNALIERRGARTALITTEGFRDVIEMRTESRFEQYDLNLQLPKPLLPRFRRFVVRERIDANGRVLLPLDTDGLDAVIDELKAARIESVAVGFLHSYVNDAHEQAVARQLEAALPDVTVSLSSEVSPQMREYERFNTVVANAYIKPMMKSYLERLQGRLQEEGMQGDIFMMHSGGGIIAVESAAEFPVRLVESGPAGGAVFAATIAQRHQLDKVLSFDMGGTTAKICLINNHTPKTSRVFEVARSYRFKKGSGMPISIPVIDMVEIGAGGGSLADVDSLQQIRVGPESAGSEPGPACYGRGGERPAVTDADLMLGKLDPNHFAGGSITLRPEQAEAALLGTLGQALDCDATTAAFGLAEVVDENMANAARVHAVENGEDLADYTMIAFGGAAPLHAGRLAEKLGMKRLLVPPGAGVGSAIGFLKAPFSFEATRSMVHSLKDFKPDIIKNLFAELRHEATLFVRHCDADSGIHVEFTVYMRYAGQGWEIPVVLKSSDTREPDAITYLARFEAVYERLFGRVVGGMDVDITSWSANASTVAEVDHESAVAEAPAHEPTAYTDFPTRPLFDPASADFLDAKVVSRVALQPGRVLDGPLAITENETTIIVPASRTAHCHSDGCIELTARPATKQEASA